MNEIDYAIMVVIFISLLIGFLRGFVAEMLSLIGWIIGIWLGLIYYHDLANILAPMIEIASVREICAFVIVLGVILICSHFINYLLSYWVEKLSLISINRFFGTCLGLVRGILFTILSVLLIESTPINKYAIWQQSLLIPVFHPAALELEKILPFDIKNLGY